MFLTLFGYCLFAFLLAASEIEIEGKHGWAERLPTWYRTHGRAARIYQLLLGRRPLTGSVVFMTSLVVVSVHMPYFDGVRWTLSGELMTCAKYSILAVAWDLLWFVLNPHYTLEKFSPKHIWWHAQVDWTQIGTLRMPTQYIQGLTFSFLFAAGAGALNRDLATALELHTVFTLGFTVFIALCTRYAHRYHAWYRRMREEDHRPTANIFHT